MPEVAHLDQLRERRAFLRERLEREIELEQRHRRRPGVASHLDRFIQRHARRIAAAFAPRTARARRA